MIFGRVYLWFKKVSFYKELFQQTPQNSPRKAWENLTEKHASLDFFKKNQSGLYIV